MDKRLTPNQIEVLRELQGCDRMKSGGRYWTYPDGTKARMFMPMEFGGSNGSHHSGTAKALAIRGFVDRMKASHAGISLNNFKSRAKGSCHYRITEAGAEALSAALATD